MVDGDFIRGVAESGDRVNTELAAAVMVKKEGKQTQEERGWLRESEPR